MFTQKYFGVAEDKVANISQELAEAFEQCRLDNAHEVCDPRRVRRLTTCKREQISKEKTGGVVYWMSRDSRVQDNWALIYAQELAIAGNCPLYVVFCLTKTFIDASLRQFSFLLDGLKIVREECVKLNIRFVMLNDCGPVVLPDWVRQYNISAVICDFNPLREVKNWVTNVGLKLPTDVYFAQVDAHNVVPCWIASTKQEFSARFFRNKVNKVLDSFLVPFPAIKTHPVTSTVFLDPLTSNAIDWCDLLSSRSVNNNVAPVKWTLPGYNAAIERFAVFLHELLYDYMNNRNDPTKKNQSNLSPFLHFGQISAQRIIYHVLTNKLPLSKNKSLNKLMKNCENFIEECLYRRELTDNFCFYNVNYDSIVGAPEWARKTLSLHANDKRPYVYTLDQLENYQTHDPLWNASQFDLVHNGKMHGYMRMYWAKKILEWTSSAEQALAFAIYLNNHYGLDGRDPNGYVGCMWSICGLHDRAFAERPIFGKIRYMNAEGCKRKFNIQNYMFEFDRYRFQYSLQ